ncbi:MAG TPA: CPBP family intramembrane glutamic endopeptidase [Cellulomonas sp.]|nr:CPBP family intramembrane glutamic endopeptidase [Cellulomonas sp.]
MALVSVVYLVGVVVPLTRPAFLDARYHLGLHGALVTAFVVIPLGTILLEEVAFRSVLWGMLSRHATTWRVLLISSALFGLWHILPSLHVATANHGVGGLVRGAGAAAGAPMSAARAGPADECGARRRLWLASKGARGRLVRPASLATRIRPLARARRQWRSSRSGRRPPVALAANAVIRTPWTSSKRSCTPGGVVPCGRWAASPLGQPVMSIRRVSSATHAPARTSSCAS